MDKKIKELHPALIWNFFYDLTQIPRPSKKEGRVADYVRKFGENRSLETMVDDVGNVIIKKPATPGMENRKVLLLQGHLDMVPQKNSDKHHDFENDPIEAFIDEGWVCANGTTLGADNGIGVAAALAVMDSNDLVHGPIEALFTIDEESGMTGAFGLKKGVLNADIMLNMDSEEEGELFVGCAGGLDANISFQYNEVPAPKGSLAFRLKISGLKGGHSGLDIALGRANANKLLFRFLKHAVTDLDAWIAKVDGGGLRNAIPREAEAILVIPAGKEDELNKSVQKFEALYKSEFSDVEPDLKFTLMKTVMPGSLIDKVTQSKLINGIIACPNGVMRMSNSMPGLVETSTNLASVNSKEGNIEIKCLMRSSVDSSRDELGGMMNSLFNLAGADIHFAGAYPGWKPDMNSEILAVMKEVYQELFGKTPEVKALHAGLECGLIGGVYPQLDMISFGPTIRNPHSPDEKVDIESVHRFWLLLVETLKNIPVKK
jgi:dipeptidase D